MTCSDRHLLVDDRFVYAYNNSDIEKIVSSLSRSYARSVPGKADQNDFQQEAWLAVLETCDRLDPKEDHTHFVNSVWLAITHRFLNEMVDPFTSTMKRDLQCEVPYIEGEEVEIDFGDEGQALLSAGYTASTEDCVAVKELLEKLIEEVKKTNNPLLVSAFVSILREEKRDEKILSKTSYWKYRQQIAFMARTLSGEELSEAA